MTNFEKFKDDILRITNEENSVIAVTKTGVKACHHIKCETCKFDSAPECGLARINWLYEEYKVKPAISSKTYYFLKSLPEGVRIKRSDGMLYMQVGDKIVDTSYYGNQFIPAFPIEQNKWFEVSDLLTWEVVE